MATSGGACDELARGHVESGDGKVQVNPVARACALFEEFRKASLLCPRKTYVAENEVSGDVRRMIAFWWETAAERWHEQPLGQNATAVCSLIRSVIVCKLTLSQVEEFMSLSASFTCHIGRVCQPNALGFSATATTHLKP